MPTLDNAAFEVLVRQHHRRLLAYALALVAAPPVAEDLTQDALLIAYRDRDRFDPGRDFGAWVRGILRNKYREWARDHGEPTLDEASLAAVEHQHAEWDQAERTPGDALLALQECLGKLPEALRAAVDLFYLQRLPGAAVATRLASSEATVRKRLQRARESLAACIRETLRRADLPAGFAP